MMTSKQKPFFRILLQITVCFLLPQPDQVRGEAAASIERGLIDFLFSPCKCRCGVPNREARLLGGESMRGYEFPWVTLIQIRESDPVPATLINNKYVITSASRIIGLTPYDMKVTLGQFDRCFADTSSTNVSVDKIIPHPDFSPGRKTHDLALIKLSTPIIFERRISPICLSVPGNKYLGQVATVVGWSEKTDVCRPKKSGLPVLGPVECSAAEKKLVNVDQGCIGVVGAPSVICQSDGGGPVMFRSYGGIYEIIGVLSDQNECGNVSLALYTKINEHLWWIKENTKDACFCFKT